MMKSNSFYGVGWLGLALSRHDMSTRRRFKTSVVFSSVVRLDVLACEDVRVRSLFERRCVKQREESIRR